MPAYLFFLGPAVLNLTAVSQTLSFLHLQFHRCFFLFLELHRAREACSHPDPGKRSDAVYEVPRALQLHYKETPPLQGVRTCKRYRQHTTHLSHHREAEQLAASSDLVIFGNENGYIRQSPECFSLFHTHSFHSSVVK